MGRMRASPKTDATAWADVEGARRAAGAPAPAVEPGPKDPAPEAPAKAARPRFGAAYRLLIVKHANGCKKPGEPGTLLWREGVYASHLTTWCHQRE
jgi:hypothetical protein